MDNNNPITYTANENLVKNKPWYKTWRIVYALLGIVLIIELIFGLKTLLSPLPKFQTQKLQPLTGASISLLSNKPNYKVGETVPVRIQVSAGGHATIGTDLILSYNPKVLEASTTSVIRGKIYNSYPLVSVDSKNGVIKISGIASTSKQAFNRVGDLGVINFKAKGVGTVNLIVDFKKGKTDDSNVMGVSTNEDLLEKVSNLKITVQ